MDPGNRRRLVAMNQRGFSLLELTAIIAIAAMIAAAWIITVGARTPYGAASAVAQLGATLDGARALAGTSGAGATLVLAPDGGGETVAIYSGRPTGGSAPTGPVRTARLAVPVTATALATNQFAIFISSSGTASAAVWRPGDPGLTTEPSCTAPIALVVGTGSDAQTHTVNCDAAVLQ